MVSRTQLTPFAVWWWTMDRLTLAALGALILAGVILLLAASTPVATKLGLDPFHFVNRQILYLLPAIAIMLGTSFLSPQQVRRVALVVFVVGMAMNTLSWLVVGRSASFECRWRFPSKASMFVTTLASYLTSPQTSQIRVNTLGIVISRVSAQVVYVV